MGFKKHNWVKFGGKGNIINLEVEGDMRQKLDSFRINDIINDGPRVFSILKEKYGINLFFKEPKEKIEKEKDWIDKKMKQDLGWF